TGRKQAAGARRFLRRCPRVLHGRRIKPRRGAADVSFADVTSDIDELRGFDVIGVTEKELGESLLDRMETIARIRVALDQATIQTPLHVFGSLDPLLSVMYFASGAEIFDGLTWLYLASHDGLWTYGD